MNKLLISSSYIRISK